MNASISGLNSAAVTTGNLEKYPQRRLAGRFDLSAACRILVSTNGHIDSHRVDHPDPFASAIGAASRLKLGEWHTAITFCNHGIGGMKRCKIKPAEILSVS